MYFRKDLVLSKLLVFDITNLYDLDVYNVLKNAVSTTRRKKVKNFYFLKMLKYNEYGKTFLKNIKLYFSLSHSNKWVVCGLSNNEIGVDIEKIDKINIDIAKSAFCETEYDYIISSGKYEQYKKIYRYGR